MHFFIKATLVKCFLQKKLAMLRLQFAAFNFITNGLLYRGIYSQETNLGF